MAGMDHEAVANATDALMAQGVRVLNPFLYGTGPDDEAGHVRCLLGLLALPHGARVVDAGSGTGAVAEAMAAHRPDLRFWLVNTNAHQNSLAPDGMPFTVLPYDFHDMPLGDGEADAVMFNASLGHSDDPLRALREAARVLRDGGVLLLNDMQRHAGDNAALTDALNYRAWPAEALIGWARMAGFEFVCDAAQSVEASDARFRGLFDPQEYAQVMAGVAPFLGRFVRRRHKGEVESATWRHERIGFQFSGGRDSLAALFLLRAHWERMTVYHLDTGDLFPETCEVVKRIEAMVPNFVRIKGRRAQTEATHGVPSDLVPTSCTPPGRLVSGATLRIIDRYECCYRSLMAPMHERMVEDGITLIVRGQRDSDYATPPMRSGQWQGGMEVLYPVQSWSAEQVMLFLAAIEQAPPPFYERGMKSAPECMTCTAWLDEGRAAYLAKYHPVAFHDYQRRLGAIHAAIAPHLRDMAAELPPQGD